MGEAIAWVILVFAALVIGFFVVPYVVKEMSRRNKDPDE